MDPGPEWGVYEMVKEINKDRGVSKVLRNDGVYVKVCVRMMFCTEHTDE